MRISPDRARGAVKGLLARRPARGLALRAAAARGHGLCLLFHRIGPGGPAEHEVVRTVPEALFRAQLEILGELGDVVATADLYAEPAASGRPRFALTFDDDYDCHRRAAAILAELGMPGTFFLGGRALHGLGAYWWEVLEHRIATEGLAAAAASVGLPGADSPGTLAGRCEGTALAGRLAAEAETDATPFAHLDADGVAVIAATPGMVIGFHTLHHPLLPVLPDAGVQTALVEGRGELAALVGQPVDQAAYPHGKASPTVAGAAQAAGYRLAWTGRPAPIRASEDAHLLPRWEPHDLDVDAFVAQLLVRLHRADPNAGPAQRTAARSGASQTSARDL
jgi:peptidoglycan/xylan/chitin deacetylase (PgdA/CDA1 family)